MIKKKIVLIISVFILSSICFGENITSLQDSVDVALIYRNTFKTAMNDNELSKDEEIILKSLELILNLNDYQISSIRREFLTIAPIKINRSGQWEFVLQNIVLAGGLYGWGIPYGIGVEDAKWIVGSEMISLSVAFYLTNKLTKNVELSHSRVQMMRVGALVGLRYGYLINRVAGFKLDMDGEKAWIWTIMTTVPAGIFSYDYLYRHDKISTGHAWAIGLWNELSGSVFRTMHRLIDSKPEEPEYYYGWDSQQLETYDKNYADWEKKHDKWLKNQAIIELIAYPLGTYIERKIFGERQYSFGDGIMLINGRYYGWLYGHMLSVVMDMENNGNSADFTRILGAVGGTIGMDYFIKGKDYNFGESIMVNLGILTGMAFGGGLSIIFEVNEPKVIIGGMMLTGAVGFVLANKLLDIKLESSNKNISEDISLQFFPGIYLEKKGNGFSYCPGINLNLNF